MRRAVAAFSLLLPLLLCAQSYDPWVNDDVGRRLWQERFNDTDLDFHSALRPYSPALDQLTDSSRFRVELGQRLALMPIIGMETTYSPEGTDPSRESMTLLLSGGMRLDYRPLKTLRLRADLIGGYASQDNADSVLISSEVLPGIGRYSPDAEGAGALFLPLFDLAYTPSEAFRISVGRGKHFIGHGYRSVTLSDHAGPYPYAQLTANVWRLQYTSLFSQQQGVADIFSQPADFADKYTATHVLSWNISPKVDVQLFESIIWQGRDSLSDRGFDVNYLNPIIFYRPVEFSLGSADNAIIGLGASFKIDPGHQFYAQLALDEFLLSELRAANGWWANKFGLQAGAKAYDAFGIEGLYAQGEINLARPFTYSHGSPLQSYGHLNEPLAHPLGANFYEALMIGAYRRGRFELRDQVVWSQYGRDVGGQNLGGNIFRSYASPERIFGNSIGQGARFEQISNSIWLSYIIDEGSDFRLQLGHRFFYDYGQALNAQRHQVNVSLRMNFRDAYR